MIIKKITGNELKIIAAYPKGYFLPENSCFVSKNTFTPDKINPRTENNKPKGTVRILNKQLTESKPNTTETMPEILYTLKSRIIQQKSSSTAGAICSNTIEITSQYNYW